MYLGAVEDNEGREPVEATLTVDGEIQYDLPEGAIFGTHEHGGIEHTHYRDEPVKLFVCPICGLEACGHNLPFVEDKR